MHRRITAVLFALCAVSFLTRVEAADKGPKTEKAPIIAAGAVKVQMDEPVLIDQAPPTLRFWGPYRMPKVYRMPGGEICLTFQVGRDAYCDQGIKSPVFVSRDEGRTWRRTEWPHPGFTGINPQVSPILDGEYLCVPAVQGIKLDAKRLPKLLPSNMAEYGNPLHFRRLADCPEDVVAWFTDIKAMRWSPKTHAWTQEQVQWPHRGQLLWSNTTTLESAPGKWDLARGEWSQKVYFESPVVPSGKELFHMDYWTQYETPSGKVPASWECYLMVSADNGRSWTRRSTIATDIPHDNLDEPIIEMNRAGELVCIMRRDVGVAHPMHLAISKDRGLTWTPSQELFQFGVFPRLLQLGNGVMVLSFGRPGVWLSFSLDGGHSWTARQPVLAGDPKNPQRHSCGYTSLVALDKDSFLLAYSEFERPNPQGKPAKAILARRITVKPRE